MISSLSSQVADWLEPSIPLYRGAMVRRQGHPKAPLFCYYFFETDGACNISPSIGAAVWVLSVGSCEYVARFQGYLISWSVLLLK